MTVSVTLTFSTEAEMLAYFSGKSAAPKAATPAHSPRTAEPTPEPEAAAPATKELDFDADVVPALKALAAKDKAAFGAMMKKHGCAKVGDVQGKPAIWAEIVAAAA